jgi:hypothetical protein
LIHHGRHQEERPPTVFQRQRHLGDRRRLIFLGLTDGTVAAYDDVTFDELWKINVGSGFNALPPTFEVNGKQPVATATGLYTTGKHALDHTPELKDQRNATVLCGFGLCPVILRIAEAQAGQMERDATISAAAATCSAFLTRSMTRAFQAQDQGWVIDHPLAERLCDLFGAGRKKPLGDLNSSTIMKWLARPCRKRLERRDCRAYYYFGSFRGRPPRCADVGSSKRIGGIGERGAF